MRKIILLLLVVTAFGCSKDNNGDNTQTLSFGTFEKSKGVPTPPNWLQGKWERYDCEAIKKFGVSCIVDSSQIQKPNGLTFGKDSNVLYIRNENKFVFCQKMTDVADSFDGSHSNKYLFNEYTKIDSNTIRVKEGIINEGDKECNNCKTYYLHKI